MYDVILNWLIIDSFASYIHTYALMLLKDLTSSLLCVISGMLTLEPGVLGPWTLA